MLATASESGSVRPSEQAAKEISSLMLRLLPPPLLLPPPQPLLAQFHLHFCFARLPPWRKGGIRLPAEILARGL
eukprot:1459015-Rhodomonas_salina.5